MNEPFQNGLSSKESQQLQRGAVSVDLKCQPTQQIPLGGVGGKPSAVGGRLAAAVTLAVSRSIRAASSGASADTGASREGSRDTGRAGRRVSETALAVDLFALAVGPTASVVLGVDASVRTAWHRDAARFGASPHGALGRRMGWRGSGPPETLDAVADQMGTTRMWVARWSRAAVRAGRAGSGG